MKKLDLGIDIGGTFIKYALVDKDFNIIEKWKIPSIKFETSNEFYDYIRSNIKHINDINDIAVSSAGLIDEDSNVKSYAAPNIRIMYGTNINKEIGKRSGKKVISINDAKAAGLCELKIGNGKGSKSSAYLIIGTGTGGCICNENDVIYGKDGFAGEFHLLPFLDLKNREVLCQGNYSSMCGLIEIYNENVNEDEAVKYGQEVTEKYLSGDEIAKKSIDEWIHNITIQLLTIAVFYNPEIICVGGGISQEDWFIELIREAFNNECKSFFPINYLSTKIDRCKYSNDANILGAITKLNVVNNK